jgi:hypothetical protein
MSNAPDWLTDDLIEPPAIADGYGWVTMQRKDDPVSYWRSIRDDVKDDYCRAARGLLLSNGVGVADFGGVGLGSSAGP